MNSGKGRGSLQLLLVVALIFASFVALFVLQNAQTVPIRFFAWATETSVAVIALAAAALGAISAVLAGFVRSLAIGFKLRQAKAELSRIERRMNELEKERNELESRLRLAEERAVSAAAAADATATADQAEGGAEEDGEARS